MKLQANYLSPIQIQWLEDNVCMADIVDISVCQLEENLWIVTWRKCSCGSETIRRHFFVVLRKVAGVVFQSQVGGKVVLNIGLYGIKLSLKSTGNIISINKTWYDWVPNSILFHLYFRWTRDSLGAMMQKADQSCEAEHATCRFNDSEHSYRAYRDLQLSNST